MYKEREEYERDCWQREVKGHSRLTFEEWLLSDPGNRSSVNSILLKPVSANLGIFDEQARSVSPPRSNSPRTRALIERSSLIRPTISRRSSFKESSSPVSMCNNNMSQTCIRGHTQNWRVGTCTYREVKHACILNTCRLHMRLSPVLIIYGHQTRARS